MKKLSKKIIKSLMVSAAFSLLGTTAQAGDETSANITETNDGHIDEHNKILKTKIFHNILKISPTGRVYAVDSHRSHRSHSSHRSSRYSSATSPKAVAQVKEYETYSLGDRILTKGMYGKDVNELVGKLIKYYYLRPDFSAQKSGYSLYDAAVVEAVKNFQQDAGLPVTGSFGKEDKAALDKWDVSKTKIRLGIRDLSREFRGNDVYELVQLLGKAGCPPDPKLLEEDGQLYTADVEMAVRVFQAFAGMPVTGIADWDTVSKLKSVAK